MNKAVRVFLFILCIATGALFIYSAWTKLFPIQGFEYTLVQFIHMPLMAAKVVSRFFIGLEGALGVVLIFHLFDAGKWPLKIAFALVAVFSIYLIWLWIAVGNNVNCGCFGDAVWMSPSSSLVKNALLLIALAVLLRYHRGMPWQWANFMGIVVLVCTLSLPYIILPVERTYRLDLSSLYASGSNKPAVDLTKGKHIIAFLNPQCMHCRKTGLKIHQMLLKDSTLPFFLVIGGTQSDLTDFWKDSQAESVQHMRLAPGPFNKITGGIYPQIYWVNNGIVEENTSYPELDEKAIQRWEK